MYSGNHNVTAGLTPVLGRRMLEFCLRLGRRVMDTIQMTTYWLRFARPWTSWTNTTQITLMFSALIMQRLTGNDVPMLSQPPIWLLTLQELINRIGYVSSKTRMGTNEKFPWTMDDFMMDHHSHFTSQKIIQHTPVISRACMKSFKSDMKGGHH